MRTYLIDEEMKERENKLTAVICNCCNKNLLVENGILKQECIHVAHDFGYFSERDGETHSFDLCEDCYASIIARFRVPVENAERKELL
ncbi:MAG: hypothetical protein NC321_04350 [Clostridium sp.]|nr:hypothetical protein [Clostridium sp.]